MTAAPRETAFQKFRRIYTGEGSAGIWKRARSRIFRLYASLKAAAGHLKKYITGAVFKAGAHFRGVVIGGKVKRDPILVFQMGKVGSMALEASLVNAYRNLGLGTAIYHIHYLSRFEQAEKTIRERGRGKPALEHLEKARWLRNEIEKNTQQMWNVISLVRDPVARNIAAYFQHLDTYIPDWKERWRNKSLLIEELLDQFFADNEIHESPYWFETQFRPIFGIDVYATPFPHQAGFEIYRNPPRANLLLIRLENLDQVAGSAMKKYLGLPEFTLKKINIGEEKEYAEVYRALKRTPIPAFYVERMYSTPLARQFYTQDELAGFARRWLQGAA